VLVDTHAHLNMDRFDGDRERVLERARRAAVKAVLDVGTDLKSSLKAVGLSRIFPELYAAAGIHPHDAARAGKDDFLDLADILEEKKCVALGETGLDFHYDYSPRETQKQVFEKQLRLARERNLPVIIHVREAMAEALAVIDGVAGSGWRGVFHCFSGTAEELDPVLERGFHISFTGVITFSNFTKQEAVRRVPPDRLLLETDCPYMAPEPYRGKRCEPAHVARTAEKAAEIMQMSLDELAKTTTDNARRLFGLEL